MTTQVSRLVVEIDSGPAKAGADRVVSALNRIQFAAQQAGLSITQAMKSFNKASSTIRQTNSVLGSTTRSFQQASRSTQNLGRGLVTTNRRLGQIEHQSHRTSKGISILATNFKILRNLYITKRFIEGITAMGNAFVQTQVEMDKIKSTLTAVTGDTKLAKEEFNWLAEKADYAGVSLQDLAFQYAKVSAATKGTALEGERTRRIFESLIVATTTLHMTGDELKFTFMAIQQMLSKGTVSMEELKRQLGERIPGVLHDAAKAMGFEGETAVDELAKALKQGQVKTTEFIENFTRLIEERFAKGFKIARVAMQAELTRMGNAWFLFKAKIMEGKVEESYILLLSRINQKLKDMSKESEGWADSIATIITNVTEDFEVLANTDFLQARFNLEGWDRLFSYFKNTKVFQAFWDDLSKGFPEALEIIKVGLASIPDFMILIGQMIGTQLGYWVTWFSNMSTAAGLLIDSLTAYIKLKFAQLWPEIKRGFIDMINWLLGKAQTFVNVMKGLVSFTDSVSFMPFVPNLSGLEGQLDTVTEGIDNLRTSLTKTSESITKDDKAIQTYTAQLAAAEKGLEELSAARERNSEIFTQMTQQQLSDYTASINKGKEAMEAARTEAKANLEAAKAAREKAKAEGSTENPFEFTPGKLGGGKGGGGKSGAAKAAREAAKAQKEYNKALEEYNTLLMNAGITRGRDEKAIKDYIASMHKLTEAMKLGIGTQEEYQKIIGDLKYKLALARGEILDYEKVLEESAKAFASGFSTYIVDAIADGKASFQDFVKSVIKGFAKMMLEMQMMRWFEAWGLIKPSGYGGYTPSFGANGLAFNNGKIVPMALGGLINQPTLFPTSGGVALAGEAGTEAVVPLERYNGKLGVGASPVNIVTNIHNNANTKVTEKTSTDNKGNVQTDIYIEEKIDKYFNSGRADPVLNRNYGMTRRGY